MVHDQPTPAAALLHTLALFPRTILHGIKSTAAASSSGRSGWLGKAYGWPPPRLDPARETAWLDGLRGIAAFLVMTYHFHNASHGFGLEAPYDFYGPKSWQLWRLPFIRIFVCGGHVQVSIFFVLSGFVLSWSSLPSIRGARYDKLFQSLSSAVFRRWFRLYLPCFVVGFWYLAEYWTNIAPIAIEEHDTLPGQLWDYMWTFERFANPFKLQRGELEAIFAYCWTFWTIPHEWAGSLMIFVTLLAVGRISDYARRTVVVGFVTFYACSQAMWAYWLFMSGMMLADYVREMGGFAQLSNKAASRPLSRIFWWIVFLSGMFIGGVPEHSPFYERNGVWKPFVWAPEKYMPIESGARFWWNLGGILIVLGMSHLPSCRGICESSFARYLGRVSFMLYLIHQGANEAIGQPIRLVIWEHLGWKEFSETFKMEVYVTTFSVTVFSYLLSWAILLPITLFMAHWLEVLVDAPCTRFARWLDNRFVKGFTSDGEQLHQQPQQQERQNEMLQLPS